MKTKRYCYICGTELDEEIDGWRWCSKCATFRRITAANPANIPDDELLAEVERRGFALARPTP